MARYQFETDSDDPGLAARGTRIAHLVVRGCGFLLLVVGLWIALAVIAEAWSLYQEPQRVERFADAIEQGSHLDRALAAASTGHSPPNEDAASPAEVLEQAQNAPPAGANGFRLSYFVAWVLTILLLMLIGRLAIAAVKTGGELVLYDLQIKRFVRELMREIKSP